MSKVEGRGRLMRYILYAVETETGFQFEKEIVALGDLDRLGVKYDSSVQVLTLDQLSLKSWNGYKDLFIEARYADLDEMYKDLEDSE